MSYTDSTKAAGTATSISVDKPTGTLEGDVLTLVLLVENSDPALTLPSGFVQQDKISIATSRQKHLYYCTKTAGASEPSTYAVTKATTAVLQAYMFAHSGRDTVATTGISTVNEIANSSPVAAVLTGYTAAANDDVIAVTVFKNATAWDFSAIAPPTGYTEREEDLGAWLGINIGTLDALSAGATGSLGATATLTSGTSEYLGYVIALPATPSGPTLTGPSSVTEGTSTSTVGTGQDTVTTLSIQTTDEAFSVEQTKGVATGTGIPFTPASGINTCSIGVPAAGVPLVPTVSAAGITAYATEIKEV